MTLALMAANDDVRLLLWSWMALESGRPRTLSHQVDGKDSEQTRLGTSIYLLHQQFSKLESWAKRLPLIVPATNELSSHDTTFTGPGPFGKNPESDLMVTLVFFSVLGTKARVPGQSAHSSCFTPLIGGSERATSVEREIIISVVVFFSPQSNTTIVRLPKEKEEPRWAPDPDD